MARILVGTASWADPSLVKTKRFYPNKVSLPKTLRGSARLVLGITMRVRLQPPNAQDAFYLIKVDEFMQVVDQADLAQRNSRNIESAYHKHWLSLCPDGSYLFHAPQFYLTKGVAKFINGRHRTLLLCQHLDEIPMALTNMDGHPIWTAHPHQSSADSLSHMFIHELSGQEMFTFPDLPVKYLGYDDNIGK